jgi:hypothetical protein
LISWVAKGENLVQTWLDFASIFAFFCYLDAWGDGRGEDETSFRLGCVLLDFCICCVILPLISSGVTAGHRTKPRSDLAWLSLICVFFVLWYSLIWCVAKGENLVQTWLDFAWFFAFFAI